MFYDAKLRFVDVFEKKRVLLYLNNWTHDPSIVKWWLCDVEITSYNKNKARDLFRITRNPHKNQNFLFQIWLRPDQRASLNNDEERK